MQNDTVSANLIAACRFDADASPAFLTNKGFGASITRTGAGNYVLTLDTPCDALAMICAACIIEDQPATGAGISVQAVSDTTINVTTSDMTALADFDFSLAIFKLAGV
jgi:hypothetical protein